MDPWFTNSATVWILTEPFLLLGPQLLPTGCLPPRTKNSICIALKGSGRKGHPFYSALLTWKWMFFWCFLCCFSPQALSLDKRCRDSRQKRQRQQGVWNQQSRSDACWWDCNPKWTALKGRTEVLPNYGTSSSKISLNYLNSQLHHRFIFNRAGV